MKPALVTGATGFVGWHVARQLLERGGRVRVLARPASRVRELEGAEPVTGDLRDASAMNRAVAGCGVVYHVAADYRLWVPRPNDLYESNVQGTRNLLDAARRAGVERVVYTSTVGCIGFPQNGTGDESTLVSLTEMSGHYKRSKFLAEQEALKAAQAGLPVVIVNPTAPTGDHDFKPTPTGKVIVDFAKGKLPAYIETGLNLVDVRDVARGHLLACDKGKAGDRYILGCENLTLGQILERLSPLCGRPAPRVRIPYAVAYAVGLASTALANITGRTPLAPIEGVRMARHKMWVTHDKARRELGYEPGPVGVALARAVDWFRANGYC
ncbi:MAG: NAD-dependent epimerase/dehydratase family protein [Acidobacteria bacterium]|nr:NAD-dependent epimerase/dehydratase family protein [Acidobacteriota bacterium]